MMPSHPSPLSPSRPELIIAFVGAVGVNTEKVYQKLETLLREVGYQSHTIRVMDLIGQLPSFEPVQKSLKTFVYDTR